MADQIGLWIDHERAVIVRLQPVGNTVDEIESEVGKHLRDHGGTRGSAPYSPSHGEAGDQQDRRYYQHLDRFYDEVIGRIKDAESILVVGPGEAKGEFDKRVARDKNLHRRLVKLQPADKMTKPQLVALVREHFQQA